MRTLLEACVERGLWRGFDHGLVVASVTSATFTRDGQCLLIGAADNKLRLLDKNTGELLLE